MQSGGVRTSALVPVPSEDGTTTRPGRAEAASWLKSAGVAVGTSIGTSSAVDAPSSMARKHAASAETLWLICSFSSKTSAPALFVAARGGEFWFPLRGRQPQTQDPTLPPHK